METVVLQRASSDMPWGFRLYGGCDYGQPLTVQKVTEGSVASEKVGDGDVIVTIGSMNTSSLTHAQAMQAIKTSGMSLQLGILRRSGQYQEASMISSPQFDRQLSLNDPVQTNGSWSHGSPDGGPRQEPQKVPDAVLNMAARGDSSKKPFAYVTDIGDIQMQREKVKKKSPGHQIIPSYQNMLNMPQFDDPPRARGNQSKFATPASPPIQDGGEAVVSNLQFNSPLQMYSADNVIESLRGQTGAEIKDVVGLPKKEKSDITQSPVYKMIHGIDQPRPKPAISYVENKPADNERHQQDEYSQDGHPQKPVRYTGQHIPSRSFRMLQDMTSGDNTPASATLKFQQPAIRRSHHQKQPTGNFRPPDFSQPYSGGSSPAYGMRGYGGGPRGGSMERREGSSEVDTTSIYQHLRGSDDYNEKSVRYVGKSIPSKCFKLLQDMTGGPRENDALPGPKRSPMGPASDAGHSDDGRFRSAKYPGSSIPSQSFKMLQRFVGDDQGSSSSPAVASRAPVAHQASVEDGTDF